MSLKEDILSRSGPVTARDLSEVLHELSNAVHASLAISELLSPYATPEQVELARSVEGSLLTSVQLVHSLWVRQAGSEVS